MSLHVPRADASWSLQRYQEWERAHRSCYQADGSPILSTILKKDSNGPAYGLVRPPFGLKADGLAISVPVTEGESNIAIQYKSGEREVTVFAGREAWSVLPDDAVATNRYDGPLHDRSVYTAHMTANEIRRLVRAVDRIDNRPAVVRRHDRELRESRLERKRDV